MFISRLFIQIQNILKSFPSEIIFRLYIPTTIIMDNTTFEIMPGKKFIIISDPQFRNSSIIDSILTTGLKNFCLIYEFRTINFKRSFFSHNSFLHLFYMPSCYISGFYAITSSNVAKSLRDGDSGYVNSGRFFLSLYGDPTIVSPLFNTITIRFIKYLSPFSNLILTTRYVVYQFFHRIWIK